MLTFMPGDMTATFAVQTTEDTTDEDNETFTVTLSSPSNAELATDPTAKGTITDADVPVVTIAADKSTVFESEGAAGFTLSRTGSTAAALTVTVAVTQEVDRDLLPDGATSERTVTFAVGGATAALSVALDDDDLAEVLGQAHRGGAGGLGPHGGRPGLGHGDGARSRHRTAEAGEPDGVGGGGGRRGGAVLGRVRAAPAVPPSPVPAQDGRGLRRVDGYSEQWATHRRWGWFEPDRLHGNRLGGRAGAHLPGADVQF